MKTLLDKSIPYKNIIMRAERLETEISATLPEGYLLKFFKKGDEAFWADIEAAVGEFENIEEAREYFINHYSKDILRLSERCLFALDENGDYVGTCTAWSDKNESDMVGSLHWLAVKPEFQRKGIAKALMSEIMNIFSLTYSFPVYLHTQTWSYKAILLYSRFGFRIMKSQSFSHYKNDFEDAMIILKNVLDSNSYNMLLNSSL